MVWFHSCRCSRAQIIPAKTGINLISKSLLRFSLFTEASQFQDLLLANLLHLVKNHVSFWGSIPPEIQKSCCSKDLHFGRFQAYLQLCKYMRRIWAALSTRYKLSFGNKCKSLHKCSLSLDTNKWKMIVLCSQVIFWCRFSLWLMRNRQTLAIQRGCIYILLPANS